MRQGEDLTRANCEFNLIQHLWFTRDIRGVTDGHPLALAVAKVLKSRLLAAAVLLPGAVIWALLAPLPVFAAVAGLVVLLAAWEWVGLAGYRRWPERLLYLFAIAAGLGLGWWALEYPWVRERLLWAFVLYWIIVAGELRWSAVPARRFAFALQGAFVLVPAWFSFVAVREGIAGGRWFVLTLLVVVWAADAGAYFVGRSWGRHQLASRLSPSKTWEGVAGGLIVAAVAGAVAHFWTSLDFGFLVPLAVITAIASVAGDLAESRLKRAANAKDSSRLIPGHGGILDRIDSLTSAAPIFAVGLSLVGAGR